jgi:hypothetical protein
MGSGQHRRNSCGAAVRSLHPNPTHRRLWGAKPQRERALDCLPKRGGCPVGGGQRSSTLLVVCPGPARTASNGPTSPRSAVPRSPSRNGGPATFFPCKRIPRETRKSSAAILRSAPAASGAAGGAAPSRPRGADRHRPATWRWSASRSWSRAARSCWLLRVCQAGQDTATERGYGRRHVQLVAAASVI